VKPQQNISTYKASNARAFLALVLPFALGTGAIFLILHSNIYLYYLGELLLSFFFLQTFILLHECGHLNFFKSRRLNYVFGHFFGLLTMIPYFTWKHMHSLHHRWTGWRDKDPTTEKTVEPSESPVMRIVANIAWFLFIPVFYLGYKLSNYWNLSKIKRFVNPDRYKKAVIHEFSPVDVKKIRANVGMSQSEFASAFGISVSTLRHWERGDRAPQGPALVLLNVVAKEPGLVLRALAS